MSVEGITLHWHGFTQKNNPWFDGAAWINQCPIWPQQTFMYRFMAEPAGTHAYHSHFALQRVDGVVGLFIVHKSLPQIQSFPIILMDWSHYESKTIDVTSPFSWDNLQRGSGDTYYDISIEGRGIDDVLISMIGYESSLIHGKGRYPLDAKYPLTTYKVQSEGKYRFRMFNGAGFYGYIFSIDNHKMTIVAYDGHDIDPVIADELMINTGESIDFEITADQTGEKLFWIRSRTLDETHRTSTGEYEEQARAILAYDGVTVVDPASTQTSCDTNYQCQVFNCFFGIFPDSWYRTCIYPDQLRSKEGVNVLNYNYALDGIPDETRFINIGHQQGSSIMAKQFYEPQYPIFSKRWEEGTVSCDTDNCKLPNSGCVCTQIYSLPYNKTIEFVISNYRPGSAGYYHHPLHFHGVQFAVLRVAYGPQNAITGKYSGLNPDITCDNDMCREPRWTSGRPTDINVNQPVIKNTITVPARGYVVIRMRTDNPGPWLMHCHASNHQKDMALLFEVGDRSRWAPLPANFPTECDVSYALSDKDFKKYMSESKTFGRLGGNKEFNSEDQTLNADEEEDDDGDNSNGEDDNDDEKSKESDMGSKGQNDGQPSVDDGGDSPVCKGTVILLHPDITQLKYSVKVGCYAI